MSGMKIGDLARKTGLRTSAIRYYEKEALLPPPSRLSGQRRYGMDALGRIQVIKLARQAGFTIAETRLFLSGFSTQTSPAERWRVFAASKLRALDEELTRITTMKTVLETSFRCDCPQLTDCERMMAERRCKSSAA